MSEVSISPLADVKALVFDVFGTTVDWRTSVTEELQHRTQTKRRTAAHISSSSPAATAAATAAAEGLRANLDKISWPAFAQSWRDSYAAFTRSFDPASHQWKTVDVHHRDSLVDLLTAHGLDSLYSDSEIDSLSLIWHRLRPWPDAAEGLEKLSSRYTTSTLSNGNTCLLVDLTEFGDLSFANLFSAETFKVYKPNPATYLGVVEKLGLQPHQVAMVAAHLSDLKAASGCGLRTIYVERDGEEAWNREDERYKDAKDIVDLWVSQDEDGFLTVAEEMLKISHSKAS